MLYFSSAKHLLSDAVTICVACMTHFHNALNKCKITKAASAICPHFVYGSCTHCESKIKNFVSFMLSSITVHFIVNRTQKIKYILGTYFSQKNCHFQEKALSSSLTDRNF